MVIVKVACMGEVRGSVGVVVEQRYQAEVMNHGVSVSGDAQSVHRWLRRYAAEGLGGLVDGSAKPLSCPHQMAPEVAARIVELRRAAGAGAAHDPVPPGGGAGVAVSGPVDARPLSPVVRATPHRRTSG
jgi:Homeodomain-like domain